MKKEDLSLIKRYSIMEYLERKGIRLVRKTPAYAMYRSPLREEMRPSFKVDTEKNLWIDYAEGRGGSIIDLYMRLEGCTLSEAICRLGQKAPGNTTHSYSFTNRGISISPNQRENVTASGTRRLICLSDTLPPHLQEYLTEERCIDLEKATPFLKCISYEVRGRRHEAIGFANSSGGYELRDDKTFKGTIAPKDITPIFEDKAQPVCLFEGFMDFLSFLTIRQQKSPDMPCTDWQDYVILNSTANTDKALYPLADYGHIHCMLDNDEAGRKAVEAIRQEYKWRVRDASHLYSGHNDLNDYLRSLKVKQSQDLTVTDKPQPEQDNRQNPGEKRKRGLRM